MSKQQGKSSSVDHDESKLEAKISQYMQHNGWMSVKLMRTSPAGLPDRLFLKQGRAVFLELKRKGQKPTPLQALRIKHLNEAGFTALWCDSWEGFLKLNL